MSKKLLLVLLLFVFPVCLDVYAAQTPMLQVVSSTTTTNINASILQYIPGSSTFDIKKLQLQLPGTAPVFIV
jgi:hypothetical protein